MVAYSSLSCSPNSNGYPSSNSGAWPPSPIYVSHTIATATTRIILEKGLQVSHLYVHVVLGVTAGLLLPMLLVRGLERIGFPYLFTLARKA